MWLIRETVNLTSASGVGGHVDLSTLLPTVRGVNSRDGAAKFVIENTGSVAVKICHNMTTTDGMVLSTLKQFAVGGEDGFAWPGGVPVLYIPAGGTVTVTPFTKGAP